MLAGGIHAATKAHVAIGLTSLHRLSLFCILLGMGTGFGCSGPLSQIRQRVRVQPVPTNARLVTRSSAGTIVMIPGIVGQVSDLSGMRDGLQDAMQSSGGATYEIEIIPWETSAFQPFKNLTDYDANVVRAQRISERLAQIRRDRPDESLVLLGNSGGGGLAVMAVEMLPEGVMIDRLVLTAAAVSNDYDLSMVQSRCHAVVNFYSRADGIVGWGTSVFGTIDRKNTLSAGHCGFMNADGTLRNNANLTQIEWKPEWIWQGHDGSHLGYRARKWAEVVLAPKMGIGESDVLTASAY